MCVGRAARKSQLWCLSASPALAVEGWRARCHAEHVSQQGTAHPDLVRRRPHIRILLALWPVDCAMLARPLRLAVAAKLPGRSSVCLQRAFARSSDAWSSRSPPPPSRRRWFGDGLTRMGGGRRASSQDRVPHRSPHPARVIPGRTGGATPLDCRVAP